MITLSKWKDHDGIGAGEISADAITADLRTKDNTLSFWKCRTLQDIDDAILALASARKKLDKVDVVWVTTDEVRTASGGRLRSSSGKTPIEDLIERHMDAYSLDYSRLGAVAKLIVAALEKKQYRRSAKKGVKKLLMEAVVNKRLRLEDVEDRLKSEIE